MKVITVAINNPDFIELQFYTLKKFFKGEYEYIVFNDAKSFSDFSNYDDVSMRNRIEEVCKLLDIKCINIPNIHHQYDKCESSRMADSMNYILNYQVQNPDKYLFLDNNTLFWKNDGSTWTRVIPPANRQNNQYDAKHIFAKDVNMTNYLNQKIDRAYEYQPGTQGL